MSANGRILVHTGAAILPAAAASVPILDHGFLYGDSVYEVVRTSRGRPFLFREHMDRMRRSAALIYFELPWDDEEVLSRLLALERELQTGDTYYRIVATRGPGPISLLPDGCDRPGLYLIGQRLLLPPERLYREGCSVAVVHRLRNDARALDPRAKTGNYLNNMLGLIESRKLGADDALFLNATGHLTEATTANVWIVEGGDLLTPPLAEGLLPGITRDWLFACEVGAREATIDRERLREAEEVFLSGTIKGIMPVGTIDGERVGAGGPGPVTRRLAALYGGALARA